MPNRLARIIAGLPADVRSLAGGGAINLVAAGISAVSTFSLFVLAEYLYSTAEVGAFVVAVAIFTILATVAQMGAQVGFVRFIPRLRESNRAGDLPMLTRVGVIPVIVLSLVFVTVLLMTADTWIEVFGQGQDVDAVRRHLVTMAPFIPLAALSLVLAAATQGHDTMLPAAVTERGGRPLGQVALVAATPLLGVGWLGLAYGLPYLVTVAVLAPWLLRLQRSAGAAEASPSPGATWRSMAGEFWRFAVNRGAASSFQVAIQWTDAVLLAALASVTEAGVYSISTRFLALGHLAIGAMLQAAGPKLSAALSRNDDARARAVYQTSTWWIMGAVWPMYTVVALFHEPLLGILGPAYVEAGPAVVILAGAMLFASGCGPVDVVLLMSGRSIWSMFNWMAGLIVNVVLNLLLIPSLGMVGAAIAWSASILVRNVIPVLQVKLMLGLDPFGRGYWLAAGGVAALGVLGGVIRFTLGPTWLGLAVMLAIGGPGYLALMWRRRGRMWVA